MSAADLPTSPKRLPGLRLALLAGVLLWLACPAYSLWPLAWVGVAPLILSVTRAGRFRQAFWRGYLFGWVYLGAVWYWTGLTIVAWTHSGIGWFAWFGLTLILALFYGAWGGAAWWLSRRTNGWIRILAISGAWVVLEWARTLGSLTMPWAQVSYSQYRVLPLIQVAELTGAYGVSFLVVLFNSTVVEWWRDYSSRADSSNHASRASIQRVAVAAGLVLIVCGYGAVRLGEPQTGPEITVAAMQPNFHVNSDTSQARELSVINNLTRSAEARGSISLFVWPESAAPTDAAHDFRTYLTLLSLAEQYHAAIAIGSEVRNPTTHAQYNSSVLVTPGGRQAQEYDKQQLVPFGEFIPFRNLLPQALDSTFQFPTEDITPGTNQATLNFTTRDGKAVALGPFICYESMYPAYARSMTRSGANLLITQSDDDWFQSESALEQHLSAVVLRAVENRRWVVRSTSTGITCIIDSRGKIVGRAPVNAPASVIRTVQLIASRTLYNRLGDWFVLACALLLAAICCRKAGRSEQKIDQQL